jgi:hypothetical protein
MAVSGLGARVDAVRSQSGAEIQRAHNPKLYPESGIIMSPRRRFILVINILGDVADIAGWRFSGPGTSSV